jgi:hypothetical protein
MDKDMTIGITVLIIALTCVTAITIWCRSRIEKIAAQGYGSGRETAKGLNKKDNQ